MSPLPSPPLQSMGEFCMEEHTPFGKIFGGMFYVGTNDQIMSWGI